MNLNLVCYSDLQHLGKPEGLFAYADSYLTAATSFCDQITADNTLNTWSNGSVTMLLAAHAVELFLKAAMLKKNPTAKVGGHDIAKLASDFRVEFPEPEFQWDIPFQFAYPTNLEKAELKKLKAQAPLASIFFRYPVGEDGTEWSRLYGFQPHLFLSDLATLKADFKRIRSRLDATIPKTLAPPDSTN